MRFIGDVHGQFDDYVMRLVADAPESIQVGDFGVGFREVDESPRLGPTHSFLRGNHDNPEVCRAHPNYIGDICLDGDMFCMSGAFSIDRDLRTVGIDWWPDEQLSYQSLNTAIDLYEQAKPRIVVTHDCPATVAKTLFRRHEYWPNATSKALDVMFQLHKPEIHVFGHWHMNIDQVILGTRFVCVAANDYRDIDITKR